MDKKELTCISCPMGCALTVTIDGDEIKVTGNTCKLGEVYGKNEVTNPTRMLTTSIKMADSQGHHGMLSVRTSSPIPKDKLKDCLKSIKETKVEGTYDMGDTVISNILGLHVDIIATRDLNLE